MKIFYSLLILLFAVSNLYSQNFANPNAREFLISEENNPSTFLQTNPKLFTGDDGFIVTWKDHRLGTSTRFAQKFDADGNPIGENYLIYFDDSIILKNDSSYSLGGRISSFDKNNNLLNIFDVDRSSGSGWCGTGWLGEDYEFWKSKNGFAYFFNSGGQVSSFKFDEQGNKINTWDDSLGFDDTFTINELKVSGMEDGSHILLVHKLAYVIIPAAPNRNKNIEDVFISVFDPNDSLIVSDKRLYFANGEDGDFYNDPEISRIKVISLNDQVYQVFFLNSEPLRLITRKVSKLGEIIGEKDSIIISDEHYYHDNFSISNLTESGFDILISLHNYPDDYDSFIFKFDKSGNLKDSLHTKKEFYDIQENIQKIDSVNYFAAASDGKDVFLSKFNRFEKIDSLKLNDDKVGSNEMAKNLYKKMGNYEVHYRKENDLYSRGFNGKGTLINGEKRANNLRGYFEDGNAINFWTSADYQNSKYNFIYAVYNNQDEIIVKDTLLNKNSGISVSYSIQGNYILLSLSGGETTNLFRMNSSGEIEKEKRIVRDSYAHFLKVDSGNYWLKTKNKIQLIDNNFEPLSEWINNNKNLNIYMGGERFLSVWQSVIDIMYFDTYTNYAAIFSVSGDTLVEPFKFSNSQEYNVNRLNRDEFILTYKESRYNMISVIYDKFGNYKNKFRVNTERGKSIENPSVMVDEDKLIYVWSDIKEEENGFNVYGKIYNVSEITSVKTSVNEISDFQLFQNYPNPFNPETTIKYSIPSSNKNALVTLKIYDILGKEIKTLVNNEQSSGIYEVKFDGRNLASGIYLYKLEAGNFTETKKFILMK